MPENNSHSYDTLLNEIEILKKCKHNNIAAFYGAYRSDDDIYVILSFLFNIYYQKIFISLSDELFLKQKKPKQINLLTKK